MFADRLGGDRVLREQDVPPRAPRSGVSPSRREHEQTESEAVTIGIQNASQYFRVGARICCALFEWIAAGIAPKIPNSRVITNVRAIVGGRSQPSGTGMYCGTGGGGVYLSGRCASYRTCCGAPAEPYGWP